MDTIKFLVQGSSLEPYQVVFTKEGNNINAQCSCPASIYGQYCKHRFGILAGETSGIVSGNIEHIQTVLQWLKGSDIEEAMNIVAAAEEELERAKRKVSAAKKKLAKSFTS